LNVAEKLDSPVAPQVPEIFLLEDRKDRADVLMKKFRARGVGGKHTDKPDQFIKEICQRKTCMAVIDIDLGPGREREGLDVVREIRRIQKQKKLLVYVIVLTTHTELASETTNLNIEAFISKDPSGEVDALELLNHFAEFQERRNEQWQLSIHDEIAGRHYKALRYSLDRLNPENEADLALVESNVAKALRRPSLALAQNENDKALLSAIAEQLRCARREGWTSEGLTICRSAAKILATARSSQESVQEWRKTSLSTGRGVVHPWLGDRSDEEDD
jgi:ActR/RegA family two-component response regulator